MQAQPIPTLPTRTHAASRRRNLRIAMVAPPWFDVPPDGYGGIEQMCGELANGLVARGHEVTLIAAGEDRTDARFVGTFAETPEGLGTSEGAAVELLHAVRAASELEDLDVDLVHDHTFAGPLLSICRDVPTIITAHGPIPPDTAALYGEIENLSLVAISNSQRARWPSLPWAATVYNAIRVDSFPFREEKEDHLVFLGRMHPDKGVHQAIDVARKAGRRLLIAAKCDEPVERAYFEQEVQPRLGEDVEYLGSVGSEEKRELLARAAALVFPIQWEEPFGLVMVEAMACGTPVIALRRGSVPDVVAHEVTGFVCDDLEQMVDATGRLHELKPMACREHVQTWFDHPVMTQRYEAVYRSVISGRKGRSDEVAGEAPGG